MRIELDRLPEDGGDYEGEEAVELLESGDKSEILTNGPVKYRFHAQLLGDELLVTGSVSSKVTFVCSRCADSFTKDMKEGHFSISMQIFDRSESADLTDEMREAIVCAFPSHPVCDAGCKGLCSRCGANLNREKCGCGPSGNFRWDALEGLKIK